MWEDFQFDFYQTLHVPQSLRYDSCNIQLSHYNFTSVTCEKIFSLTSTKHCMCLSHWDMIPAIYSCLIIISPQSHVRRFSVWPLYQTLHVPQSLRYDSCNMQLSHYNFTSVTCEKIFSLTSTKHCMCLSHWDMIPAIYSCLIIISPQSRVRRFSVWPLPNTACASVTEIWFL
jgi:hypothetical protein